MNFLKNLYLIIILVAFTYLFLSGCIKKCDTPVKYNIDKGTISLFANGNIGSWWVYEEEHSALQDSIYVSNYKTERNIITKEDCSDYETMSIEYNGKGVFLTTVYVRISATFKSWDNVSANNKLFSFSFQRHHDGTYEYINSEILPAYTVLGNNYSNVIKIYNKYYNLIQYFAPSIGLIRSENIPNTNNQDSAIYNLKKYHIQ